MSAIAAIPCALTFYKEYHMKSKFEVFAGGYLPGFVQPIAIIAASTVNVECTICERYVFVPKSKHSEKRFFHTGEKWKIDFEKKSIPELTFDSIFSQCVEYCQALIELEYFDQIEARDYFLRGQSYELVQCEWSKLLILKLKWDFADELLKVTAATRNEELRQYLQLVSRFEAVPPSEFDPLESQY